MNEKQEGLGLAPRNLSGPANLFRAMQRNANCQSSLHGSEINDICSQRFLASNPPCPQLPAARDFGRTSPRARNLWNPGYDVVELCDIMSDIQANTAYYWGKLNFRVGVFLSEFGLGVDNSNLFPSSGLELLQIKLWVGTWLYRLVCSETIPVQIVQEMRACPSLHPEHAQRHAGSSCCSVEKDGKLDDR